MAEVHKKYNPKAFTSLKGLKGISDGVLDSHFKLYEGYVNRTNKLTDALLALTKEGQAAGTNPAYAEMTRRLGFEYNGMLLHEYYFGNLTPSAPKDPLANFKKSCESSFGSYELW